MACLICGAAHTACPGTTPAPQHIIDLEVKHMATNTWTADRRLYLNSKGEVVEADDADRASLLVAEGGQLDLDRARQLGLVNVTEQVVENVKAAQPQANKAKAPAANKSVGGSQVEK